MRDDDNQLNHNHDDNQPNEENQLEALRAAARGRTTCRHSFRKVGAKRICSKCGLKVSGGGKPS